LLILLNGVDEWNFRLVTSLLISGTWIPLDFRGSLIVVW
jgi:hypothetical protein